MRDRIVYQRGSHFHTRGSQGARWRPHRFCLQIAYSPHITTQSEIFCWNLWNKNVYSSSCQKPRFDHCKQVGFICTSGKILVLYAPLERFCFICTSGKICHLLVTHSPSQGTAISPSPNSIRWAHEFHLCWDYLSMILCTISYICLCRSCGRTTWNKETGNFGLVLSLMRR